MTELCLYIITIHNNMKTFLKNLLVRARELQPYIQYTRRTAHTPAHKIEVQIYYVSWFWRLYMFDSLAELIRLRCTRATASCTADMARGRANDQRGGVYHNIKFYYWGMGFYTLTANQKRTCMHLQIDTISMEELNSTMQDVNYQINTTIHYFI